ncbi:SdrD B-like domain-containing protein, partial [Spirosoma sp.]|uniref:SdrD B-like domain-containing protein n=2 Tax=unclassified Spirosoma TaxID=2621999 RepID=UPI0025E75D37
MVSTLFDPFTILTGGVRMFSNLSGQATQNFQVFGWNGSETPGVSGKANGLGDLELLCDPAPIEIGNRVWKDTNNNGVQDPGEPALAGVTVQLTNASGGVIATATTDANGNYIFSSAKNGSNTASNVYSLSLAPSTSYTLKITSLGSSTSVAGLTLTGVTIAPGETAGTNTGSTINNNDAFVANGLPTINLTTGPIGANNHTYDFGLTANPPASLGDYVWFDANKNGQQDPTETGVASVTAVLYDAVSGTVVSTTLTDGQGKYLFTNLNPGSYYVKFTAPSGMTFTTANTGADATDSDVASLTGQSGTTGTYSLTAGQQELTVDAGLIPLPASLGDYVWFDTNQNGQQDPTETGVASVTAVLYDAVSGTVVSTTITDGQGKYLFTNLDPGQYYVKFTAPVGTTFTSANVGNDATDSDVSSLTGQSGMTGTYSLTAGQQDLTVDAGLLPLKASLGDYVWLDTNQNGQQDAGETGVASVIVILYNATTNQPVSTTLTDASGKYLFTNLDPGQYYVKFTAPSGMTFTTANTGPDATDSDAGVGGQTGVYSLTAGQQDLTVDAGLVPLKASLGDYVWFDTNQNGQQDPTETGVASVTAVLYNATTNQPISTTVTDANGKYLFTNLDPGSYYVKFTAPSGMTFTSANVGNDATDSDAGVGGQTSVYSLTAGQQDLTIDAGLVPVSTCVPASYTLCGANNSMTLTAGNVTQAIQWYKDGVAIPGANMVDYVATVAGVYSYSGTDAAGCSYTSCCPVSLTTCSIFDLALTKKLATGQASVIKPGSNVTFTLTVLNQGDQPAYNIQLTDYIPAGLTLNDANWNLSGSLATLKTPISGSLAPGSSTTMNITFTVSSTVSGPIINKAEISSADNDTNPNNTPPTDVDSTPDQNPTNDAGGTPNSGSDDSVNGNGKGTPGDTNPATDEDDEDPAIIYVQPCTLGANLLTTEAHCGQSDGRATVTVNTGVAPYSYAWSTGASTSVITGLSGGQNFTVTVTDANGCQDVLVGSIQSTGGPSLTATATAASCQQATGSATVTASGGSGSYTYLWSNGAITASISNVSSGTYTVRVTDGAGCVSSVAVIVPSTSPISAVATPTSASCLGANGSVTLSVSGGTAPYSYVWDNGSTSQNLTGVAGGTYKVRVTDANGCTAVATAVVANPGAPSVLGVPVNPVCFGTSTGSISVQASGGSGTYSYQWDNG